jgi:hypothetical protein
MLNTKHSHMKKLIALFAIALLVIPAFAQEDQKKNDRNNDEIRTLFGPHVKHGGYGAFTMGYSQIGNQDAVIAGGRLGWIIDHSLTLGFGGYGFANDIHIDNAETGRGYNLDGGCGGMFIEPIILPKFPVHIAIPIFFGAGGVACSRDDFYTEDSDYYIEDSDGFLFAEPGVEIELNVLKFLRLSVGASYRFTTGVHMIDTPGNVLDGLSSSLSLKIGKF